MPTVTQVDAGVSGGTVKAEVTLPKQQTVQPWPEGMYSKKPAQAKTTWDSLMAQVPPQAGVR